MPSSITPSTPSRSQTQPPMAECLTSRKRTKIVATLGPASLTEEKLRQLAEAGVNVFRLNMSHGNSSEQTERINFLHGILDNLEWPVALLADLQGPKLRTAPLKNNQPVLLEDGHTVVFTCNASESEPGIVATPCSELIGALTEGSLILLDDGKIRLSVIKKSGTNAFECQVLQGGLLEAKKGINVPGTTLPITALTEKDKNDVRAAVAAGVNYIALSFVQRSEDIVELREYVKNLGYICPPIIAKIEKPQALDHIEAILAEADGLMVARGDLGVELPPEEVPVAQKRLVAAANRAGKPIIIATQMLESMVHSLQPSRSDVSDIANAVFEGADAVMLSGETSVGEHPVEAVAMMSRIIHEAEKSIYASLDHPAEESGITSPNFYHAIAHTASYASRKANVKALVVFSNSGSMAQRVSKLKPSRPIIALTFDRLVAQGMSLFWGVTPLVISRETHTDSLLEGGEKAIFAKNLLQSGDSVVFCAGNTQIKGATNILKIYRLGEGVLE